jgi:hypothetical protein
VAITTKQDLEELYGTPTDFARVVDNLHADGVLTVKAAQAAVKSYDEEYQAAPDAPVSEKHIATAKVVKGQMVFTN